MTKAKHRKPLSGLVLTLVLLFTAANAQDFVFASNRLRAEPATGPSGTPLHQNDLFLYRNGSEIRLTFTPTEDEWDPQPSPSGRYLAYLVNDTIIDWTADELPQTWNWLVRIMDLETGLTLEEWPIPRAAGSTRVAGGFDIAWSPDENALLAQGFHDDGHGIIFRFEVGNPEPVSLTRGLGVFLHPELAWFATTQDGFVTVIDPLSGNQYPLEAGEALGWLGDEVIVGGDDRLKLMNPVTAEETRLDSTNDYYPVFVTSPAGTRHAWISYARDSAGTVITVVDSSFDRLASWLYNDFIDSLVWLDEESLIVNGMLGDNLAITQVRVEDGAEIVLVATRSDNMNVRLMPAAE